MRLRSEDKHHLRKSADRKAQSNPVSGTNAFLICAFRSADFLTWCLSSERNLTHNLFIVFGIMDVWMYFCMYVCMYAPPPLHLSLPTSLSPSRSFSPLPLSSGCSYKLTESGLASGFSILTFLTPNQKTYQSLQSHVDAFYFLLHCLK